MLLQYRPRLFLAKVLIFSIMFTQALFMFSLSFKFPKAANLFEIFIWYYFINSSSLRCLTLNLSTPNSELLVYYCQSFHNFCNHQIVISITVSSPEKVYMNDIYLLICGQSGCESSHKEGCRSIYECFGAGTWCS